MSKVLVDRELLRFLIGETELEGMAFPAGARRKPFWWRQLLSEGIAQPAEAEGVRNYLAEFYEGEVEAKTAIADLQAALSAVTAERDRLLEQVQVLQSDSNSWQSGYDKGRADAAQHRKDEVNQLRAEVEALRNLIDTPHTDEWFEAVRLEAAHQIKRWGADHDAGKAPADWFWLLGYLGGKALAAAVAGNHEKAKHHTISSGAALLNWFRAMTGDSNAMRPGIDAAMAAKEE